jgi:hypothetical protein
MDSSHHWKRPYHWLLWNALFTIAGGFTMEVVVVVLVLLLLAASALLAILLSDRRFLKDCVDRREKWNSDKDREIEKLRDTVTALRCKLLCVKESVFDVE